MSTILNKSKGQKNLDKTGDGFLRVIRFGEFYLVRMFVFVLLFSLSVDTYASCWATWSSSTTYWAGNKVSYNGVNYTANGWSSGNAYRPDQNSSGN